MRDTLGVIAGPRPLRAGRRASAGFALFPHQSCAPQPRTRSRRTQRAAPKRLFLDARRGHFVNDFGPPRLAFIGKIDKMLHRTRSFIKARILRWIGPPCRSRQFST